MPSKEKIIEDLANNSTKIGELTRTISLSVLALVWLFIAGGDGTPVLPAAPNINLLILSGLLALLSITSEYFQSVVGYINSKRVLAIAEASESKDAKYNDKSFLYRSRNKLFWLKQVFAMGSLVVLFISIYNAYVCG